MVYLVGLSFEISDAQHVYMENGEGRAGLVD